MCVDSEDANVKSVCVGGGGSGAMLPLENLRNLDCLGLHFAHFHG